MNVTYVRVIIIIVFIFQFELQSMHIDCDVGRPQTCNDLPARTSVRTIDKTDCNHGQIIRLNYQNSQYRGWYYLVQATIVNKQHER